MTNFDFILAQFRKTYNKKYENYVVTRIYNLLDDSTIKFITQQYVKRPNGYALLDLYFPQLNLYIEVDEGHHKENITSDQLRCQDIIDATNFIERRITIYDRTHSDIDSQINDEVNLIKTLKNNKIQDGSWVDWNIESEMNPDYYLNLGYIDVDDNVSFQTQNDVFKCFGKNYQKTLWICSIKHPNLENTKVWCPKFTYHKDWLNVLSDDNETITQIDRRDKRSFIDRYKDNPCNESRIAFGHIISPLGYKTYKFLGLYEFDYNLSTINDTWTYRRVSKRVDTIKWKPKKTKKDLI